MGWQLEKRERYALIEKDSENLRKHKGTFFIGPRHVKHHSTKEFVEFSYVTAPNFASEKDCRVFAQSSHVAIELYDYYAKLFDPDYENVSVYDERFDVQYLFKTKPSEDWRSVDYYNPTIQVIPLEDSVEIKRIFDTDYGTQTLEISHVVRTGRRLKHTIKFTNKTVDGKTFRVVMKLAGITNNKVKHRDGEERITAEKHIVSSFLFIGEDNQHLKLTEYLWSLGVIDEETGEWKATTLKDIVFDVHAQGCKADIIIGNYTLGLNESLLIDPDSDTFYVGGSYDDALDRGDGTFSSTGTKLYIRSYTTPTNYNYACGGFRFVSVSIPQGATISAAKLSVYGTQTPQDDPNLVIYGNDVDNAQDFDVNPHIISTSDRPRTSASVSWIQNNIGTGWKDKTGLESIVEEIVGIAEWNSGNALVLLLIANTDAEKSFYLYSYDQSSDYAAKLEVTWEEAGPTLIDVSGLVTVTGLAVSKRTKLLLGVNGSVTLSGVLSGNKSLVAKGNVTASGSLLRNKSLIIGGNVTTLGDLLTDKFLVVNGGVIASGTFLRNKKMILEGLVVAGGLLAANKPVDVNGFVTVSGIIVAAKPVEVGGLVTASGSLLRNKSLTISGSVIASGGFLRDRGMILEGDVTLAGMVLALKRRGVLGSTIATGLSFAHKKFILSGSVIANGIISIKGGAIIDVYGLIQTSGVVLVNKKLVVIGNTILSGIQDVDKGALPPVIYHWGDYAWALEQIRKALKGET